MFDLRKYFERKRSYLVFVGTPLAQPREWMRVERLEADTLIATDGQRLPLRKVRAAIVAYPNGEILEHANLFGDFPDGVTFLDYEDEVKSELDEGSLDGGRAWIVVSHGEHRRGPGEDWPYRTTLRNVSEEPVRVVKFGAYCMRDGRWMLHTASGGFFTAEQFVAWYGLDGEYIQPGERVSDPDNYGGPDALWAYFCRTESGQEFTCGGRVRQCD